MTLNEAFLRLKKDGAFTDDTNTHYYWHMIGNGFRCMASRNLDGTTPPTIHREFHVDDMPLERKRNF